MAVDPVRRNYFSLKLWADDNISVSIGRLYLYIPDSQFNAGSTKMYQVGYRHEGDYMAPMANSTVKSPLPGRFYYSTILLPLSMTSGRTSLQLTIQSTGRLYTLGSGGPPNGNYQFTQTLPSVGIYRAYTHTAAYLNVASEVQGSAPTAVTQPSPTDSVLAPGGTFYTGVTNYINGRLNANASALSVADVLMLAKAYGSTALPYYQSQAVLNQVVAAIDNFTTNYYATPSLAGGDWGGAYGGLGWSIHLLLNPLTPILDTTVNYGSGGNLSRRVAWAQMLMASRDFGRTTRDQREITNQNLIANTSIYQANRGMYDLGSPQAFTESSAQRYLLEAGGLQPWLGSDVLAGGSTHPFGYNYYQVTSKGLTREWGFVASNYGELQYTLSDYYLMTGNTVFRDQAIKMAKAKAYFRRPAIETVSGNFYTSMEATGLLAWRGANESDSNGFATEQAYADRTGADVGAHTAAVTQDPTVVGYAKQMLADNQYFTQLVSASSNYSTPAAIDVFGDYQTLLGLSDNGTRLPMTPGQPDTAWADEQEGVVAIKHGSEYLWAAPFWEAKSGTGINSIVRFHYSTPQYDQFGLIESTAIAPAGSTVFVRPNLIDKPETNFYVPPDNPSNAYAGEQIMVGPLDPGATQDDPFRGRASFWAFRFGRYLVGMNPSQQTYSLALPANFSAGTDVISGNSVSTPSAPVAGASTVAVVLSPTSDSDGTIDTCPVPGSPFAINYSATNSSVVLSWSATDGATGYSVYRRMLSDTSFSLLTTGLQSTQFTDSIVLTTNNPPYYYVVATNSCGKGYPSTTVGPVQSTALPSNFTSKDIGTVSTAGSGTYSNGVFAISGSGSDIGGTADSFQFSYFPANEDGDYIVRLLNAAATKAGIMLRASLATNSPMAITMLNTGTARYAGRASAGSSAAYTNGVTTTAPVWLRLNKTGTTLTGYSSADGTSWTKITSTTVNLGTQFYAGLAVTSRSSAAQTANFDNLTVPAPILTLQVGATSVVYPASTSITISAPNANGTSATGDVSLYDGTTLLTTLPLQAGGSTNAYTPSSLSVGTHSFQAIYGGDSSHPAGMSAIVSVSVQPMPTTISASCPNSSLSYGSSFNCTVTVSSSGGPAQGQLGYNVDGNANLVTLNNGSASISVANPAVGNHTITFTYAAQTYFAAATPVNQTFTVSAQQTPTVTASLAATTFTASDEPAATVQVSCNTACGQVDYRIDGNEWGTVPLDANGRFSASSFPSIATGAHTLQIFYLGNETYAPAASNVINFNLVPYGSTTVTVTASLAATTFTASDEPGATVQVSCNTACGEVDYRIDGNEWGTVPLDANGRFSASSFPSIATGAHTLQIFYLGNETYAPAASNVINFNLGPYGSTTVTVTASLAATAFTASDEPAATVQVSCNTACGQVDYRIDGNEWGTVPLDANGRFSASSFPSIATGAHTLQIFYVGNETYAPAASNVINFNLAPYGSTTVTVTASLAATAFTASDEPAATVQVSCNTACGQVDYRIDGNEWGTVPLDANGRFSASSFPSIATGAHTLQIFYVGNETYAPAASNVVNFTLTP